MGLKELWLVFKTPGMPPYLKYVALALAMICDPKKGANIFISVERLAQLLSLHRVTVSRRLAVLDKLGIFPVVRRGGRGARASSSKRAGYASRRTFNPAALEQFGEIAPSNGMSAPCSAKATGSDDQVAAPLLDES